MRRRFRDRYDAGRQLGEVLRPYRFVPRRLVLGLPRGGVPVAAEVARAIDAPLDVLLVRKVGVPASPEVAMGAIASGGVCVRHEPLLNRLRISEAVFAATRARESSELRRRERLYRGDRPLPDFDHRLVVLVDDGLATGATMRAAVKAMQGFALARLVVAVPVASSRAIRFVQEEPGVDRVVSLETPEPFLAVSTGYERFDPTPDAEVTALLTTPELSYSPSTAVEPRSEEERDGS